MRSSDAGASRRVCASAQRHCAGRVTARPALGRAIRPQSVCSPLLSPCAAPGAVTAIGSTKSRIARGAARALRRESVAVPGPQRRGVAFINRTRFSVKGADAGRARSLWSRVCAADPSRRRPRPLGTAPTAAPQERRKGEGDGTQKSGGGTGNTELRGASGSDSAARIRAAGLSAFSGLPARRPPPPQSPPLSLALPATFSCCLKMKQQKTFSVNQGGGTAGPRPGQCTHV